MDYVLNQEIVEEYRSFRKISETRRMKRRKALLQRTAIAVLGLIVLVLIVLMIAPSVKAEAESTVSYETRLVSVRVAENDSLWAIAERFYCEEKESIPEFIRSIKETNHLEDDTIYPDTYLVIRYYVKKTLS
ncbi:MAG: LysM peptidoglycan-binding domain-containing protein [Lachnospiraceae bacterium]|nr:LysM peptidoglycan-binding domain-containing protein [Lachnospiraceae bacterium]